MSALIVSVGLFSIGLYGVLTRRDLVAVLACVEVMIGGVLLLFVTLAPLQAAADGAVEATALILLVLAAAEAAVGLALVVAVAQAAKTTRVDELSEVRG